MPADKFANATAAASDEKIHPINGQAVIQHGKLSQNRWAKYKQTQPHTGGRYGLFEHLEHRYIRFKHSFIF